MKGTPGRGAHASLVPPPLVRIRYLRPPDRVETHEQRLVHDSPEALVTYVASAPLAREILVNGRVVLEPGSPVVWFTFPDAWHDIGRFHTAAGDFTGIYANVLTPVELGEGNQWKTTDLFLDVWMDERGVEILDRDELEEARRRSWIDDATARRAEDEAERLRAAAASGRWPPAVVAEWTLERVRQDLQP